MIQYFHDINPYVEQHDRYGADHVRLKLDEDNNQVTVVAIDVYQNPIEGQAPIVDETFQEQPNAIDFYNKMAQQLAEGDIIRHYNHPEAEVGRYHHIPSRLDNV